MKILYDSTSLHVAIRRGSLDLIKDKWMETNERRRQGKKTDLQLRVSMNVNTNRILAKNYNHLASIKNFIDLADIQYISALVCPEQSIEAIGQSIDLLYMGRDNDYLDRMDVGSNEYDLRKYGFMKQAYWTGNYNKLIKKYCGFVRNIQRNFKSINIAVCVSPSTPPLNSIQRNAWNNAIGAIDGVHECTYSLKDACGLDYLKRDLDMLSERYSKIHIVDFEVDDRAIFDAINECENVKSITFPKLVGYKGDRNHHLEINQSKIKAVGLEHLNPFL